jgi:biopolymer transport protein ExbB
MIFSSILLFLDPDAATDAVEAQKSLFELLSESGWAGLAISAMLLILSAVAVYIFIERYLTIKRAGAVDDNFINNIRMNLLNGNVNAARSLCQQVGTPISRMIEKGILRINKPLRDIEHAIENVGRIEVAKLEKNLNVLSIIAGIAPMFGFLGTVAGMIQTFQAISMTNDLTFKVIAGGIYVKMFTSALGLIVGIMAFVAYNYLNTMIERIVHNMERNSLEFLDLLQETGS